MDLLHLGVIVYFLNLDLIQFLYIFVLRAVYPLDIVRIGTVSLKLQVESSSIVD